MSPLDRLEKILTELCTVIDDLAKQESQPAPKQDNGKKLTDREVRLIREMRRNGKRVKEIARSFDVHHSTVSRIVRGAYHKGVR